MRHFQITICGTSKLDEALIGSEDAYVKLRQGITHHKTSVIKSSSSPEWNETFYFEVALPDTAELILELCDKNLVLDSVMGSYTFPLSTLTRGVVLDKVLKLHGSKSNAELHIRALAVDFGRSPASDDAWKVTHDILLDPQLVGEKLKQEDSYPSRNPVDDISPLPPPPPPPSSASTTQTAANLGCEPEPPAVGATTPGQPETSADGPRI